MESQRAAKIEAYALLFVVATYALVTARRWLPQLRARLHQHRVLLVAAGVFCLPGLVSSLLIFPRSHYLLIPGVLIVSAVAILLINPDRDRENPTIVWLAAVGLVLVMLTPIAGRNVSKLPRNVATIRALQALNIRQPVRALEGDGRFDVYLPYQLEPIAQWEKHGASFLSFLRERQIDMVVVTDNLRADWRFRHDPEWQTCLDQPSAFGYEQIAVPHTDRVIMLRSALLHPGPS